MEYYDNIATGYEELHRQEQEKKLALIKPFLNKILTQESTLLDIGCGTGISLEPWNCNKQGIDPSQKLLEIAKKKGLLVQQANAEQLPFPDKSFDICISLTALHHTNFPRAIQEIRRVCKHHFIFTILKKSLTEDFIKKNLKGFFKITKIIQEEKDIIFFCVPIKIT